MTPESFNAALAQRKLEAADILLAQAKTGSDADRIRAASAILRIAFFPTVPSASSRCSAKPSPAPVQPPPASQAESLQVHNRGQSDESARSAAPGEASPVSPPLPLPAGEGWGEGVTTLCSQVTDTSRGTPVPVLSSA